MIRVRKKHRAYGLIIVGLFLAVVGLRRHVSDEVTIEPMKTRQNDKIPLYYYVNETDALMDPDINDILSVANMTFSSISLLNGDTYIVGQPIKVRIEIRNGYNKRIDRGGDDVRVWMTEKNNRAMLSANVEDHQNGLYTAHLQAFWAGTPNISISIANVREVISILYKMIHTEKRGLRKMKGRFTNGNFSETVPCSPISNFGGEDMKYCNLTYENYGMSWYCEAPKNRNISCYDWVSVINENVLSPWSQLSRVKRALLNNTEGEQLFPNGLKVHILPGDYQKDVFIPKRECTSKLYPELWKQRSPVGFLYKQQWTSTLCHTKWQPNDITSCLTGKTIMFFGDSTIRGWFEVASRLIKCNIISEVWTYNLWHKPSVCVNADMNLTLKLMQHALPMFYGVDGYNTRYSRSIPVYLDEIDNDEKTIVIINVFAHLLPFHHSVYSERIHKIRLSVERLVQRNKHAWVVMISPHRFTSQGREHHDSFALLYDHILREEFDHLGNRVIYLNIFDITNAMHNHRIHPITETVKTNLFRVFSFTCLE